MHTGTKLFLVCFSPYHGNNTMQNMGQAKHRPNIERGEAQWLKQKKLLKMFFPEKKSSSEVQNREEEKPL